MKMALFNLKKKKKFKRDRNGVVLVPFNDTPFFSAPVFVPQPARERGIQSLVVCESVGWRSEVGSKASDRDRRKRHGPARSQARTASAVIATRVCVLDCARTGDRGYGLLGKMSIWGETGARGELVRRMMRGEAGEALRIGMFRGRRRGLGVVARPRAVGRQRGGRLGARARHETRVNAYWQRERTGEAWVSRRGHGLPVACEVRLAYWRDRFAASLGVASESATCWSQATPVRRGAARQGDQGQWLRRDRRSKSPLRVTQPAFRVGVRLYAAVSKSQVAGRAK